MSNVTFVDFKAAVAKQVQLMVSLGVPLLKTDATKEQLRTTYLESFPEGTNPIYRERRVYEGEYDLTFISQFGGVIAIVNGSIISVWDIEVGGYYQPVIEEMKKLVKGSKVVEPFIHYQNKVGVFDHNFELLEGGQTKRWDHFFSEIPSRFVMKESEIPTELNKLRTQYAVLKRSLEEISQASADVVLELIENGQLYRGDENKHRVEQFIDLKRTYTGLSDLEKEEFLWITSKELGHKSSIRNSAIGTLLVDLSEGKDLEDAVASFEDKVSEGKYKRNTAVATPKMIEQAKKTIINLGLEDALHRRYARLEDLTINNVLFANRSVRETLCPFEKLKEKSSTVAGTSKNTQEISIDDFMDNIVPNATDISVLFENKHVNNLFSLVAPVVDDSGNLFKWNNNFSWTYRGEVTDSIREKVKKAGGNVEGILRCSLSWSNTDDLDIHVKQPNGETICFHNKRSYRKGGGQLDIDMNAGGELCEDPVENVFWKEEPMEGRYEVLVNNYQKRCNDFTKNGFEVEVDHNGESTTFGSSTNPSHGAFVTVVEFDYTHKGGVEFLKKYEGQGSQKSNTMWGIDTGTFQKVDMIMHSPNFWDGQQIGNKHLFFSLANCNSDVEARGFYNEFLRDELSQHGKSFEMLSAMLKAPATPEQVSGIGFSSTKRNVAIFNVDGRLFKVLF